MIISPKEPVTKTIAFVYSDDNNVYIKFPESNDVFKGLVKNRMYFWDGWDTMRWCKQTVLSRDRHCEIIRILLENGFIVESDIEYITRAQNKDYLSEPMRWVNRKGNHFRFCWYYNENCYSEVRRLPASKYDKPCVIVPMEYYEEVVDFCAINNFHITESAQTLIEEARCKLDNILFFDDSQQTDTQKPKKDFVIHPDLLDD